jgi:hypothetical protein
LPQHYEARALQRTQKLTTGNRWQMPAHAATSMLVR